MTEKKKKSGLDETVEIKYQLPLYKLLLVFGIVLIVVFGIGFWGGHAFGFSQASDSVDVKVPDFCTKDKTDSVVTVSCYEFSNITANELCEMASTSIKERIRVVIIP